MPRVEFRCEAISSPCSRSGEELGEGMADGSVVRERNFLDAQVRRIGPERIERIRQRDRPPIFPAFLRDVNGGYLKEIAPQPGRPVRREHSFCQRKGVPVRKNKRETGKGNAHLGPRHIQIRLRQHVGERLINPEDLSPVDFKIYKRSHAFRQSDSRFPGGTSVDRKSTRLNSSHRCISYAVFCLKKKKNNKPC